MSSPPIRVLLIKGGGRIRARYSVAAAPRPDGARAFELVRVGSTAEAVERLPGGGFDAVVIALPALADIPALDAVVGQVRAQAPGIPIIVAHGGGARRPAAPPEAPAIGGPAPPRLRPSALAAIERERRRIQRVRYGAPAPADPPGKAPLAERFERAVARAAHSGRAVALLAIEFDHFVHVVEQMGGGFGDRLLRAAAERLQGVLDRSDTLLAGRRRCGFAAVVESLDRPENAGAVAARILRYLAQPFYLDGHEVTLTASIGIAVPPAVDDGDDGGGADFAALLEDAEGAMLVAAATGGGRCVLRPPRAASPRPRRATAGAMAS